MENPLTPRPGGGLSHGQSQQAGAGWTQAELAALAPVGTAYMSLLERRHPLHPAAPVLGRLTAALRGSLSDRLTEPRPPDALLLVRSPASSGGEDADWHWRITAWARMRPALAAHLSELAIRSPPSASCSTRSLIPIGDRPMPRP